MGPKISFFVLDFSTYTKQVISFVGYRFETYWLNFQPKQENEPKKTDCQKMTKKVKNAKKKFEKKKKIFFSPYFNHDITEQL